MVAEPVLIGNENRSSKELTDGMLSDQNGRHLSGRPVGGEAGAIDSEWSELVVHNGITSS